MNVISGWGTSVSAVYMLKTPYWVIKRLFYRTFPHETREYDIFLTFNNLLADSLLFLEHKVVLRVLLHLQGKL